MLQFAKTQYEKTSMIIDINAKKLGLTGSQKLILICISNHIDKDNKCFPSLQTIANKSGFTVRTVSRAILKMEELKYLAISKKYSESTKNLHNLYTLNAQLLESLASKNNVVQFKKVI